MAGHGFRRLGAVLGAGQLDALAGHLFFTVAAVPGQAFEHMAVMVAGGEIHASVDPRGVLFQYLFDPAHQLDELAPVAGREQAQAGDAVADGDLVGGLLLGVELHQALDVQPGFPQQLLDPGQGQHQGRVLSLQATRQLGDEGGGHGRCRAGHVGHRQHHALGVLLGGFHQAVGPVVGQVALAPVGHDPEGHPAQVLDQGQAQHDGDCP